jgi:hypothetical protein
MRTWLICTALLLTSTANAEEPFQIEPVTAATQYECEAVLALLPATPGNQNVWPLLGVYDKDPRQPLDCTSVFVAAKLPPYVAPPKYGQKASSVSGDINFTRPVHGSDGQVTVEKDVFVAPYFRSLTRYTLIFKDGKWVVTSEELLLIT